MNNDLETRLKGAFEKARPVIETLIADLDREATIIRERDLDPRKLADEPKVQEARSAAVDALENLTAFAKSLDTIVKSYAPEIDKRIDVDAIKEQIASAPGFVRARAEATNGHGVTEQIKETGDDVKARLEAAAQETREHVDEAATSSKEYVASRAQKGKDSTTEMLAALGWAAAAVTVIYVVLMDEKRRRQAKSMAKAAGSGLIVIVDSVSKKS